MPTPAYTSPQALIDAFGEREIVELTDREEPRANVVDTDVAQRACDRAAVEVDAALAGRYALPLATVPQLLRYIALDLAHFHLYAPTEPPESVRAAYDAANRKLRDLATGVLSLGPDVTGAEVAATPTDLVELSAGQKVFARSDAW